MHKVTEYHVGERRMRLIPRAGLHRTGALIGIARIGLRRRTFNVPAVDTQIQAVDYPVDPLFQRPSSQSGCQIYGRVVGSAMPQN